MSTITTGKVIIYKPNFNVNPVDTLLDLPVLGAENTLYVIKGYRSYLSMEWFGVPSGNSKIINRWNSLHSFSKLFIDTINTLDNISFDIIYSDSTVPTDLDVEFNDVKVFIRPIGFAV